MSLFQNGHIFGTAISLAPPGGKPVPFIEVEMAGASGFFEPVIGKLDTGACRTMLNFDTAEALGIRDLTIDCSKKTAYTANDQPFTYYVHRVIVNVPNPVGEDLLLVLEAGFAEQVRRNLFGIDWMQHLCTAIDRRQIHFLKD